MTRTLARMRLKIMGGGVALLALAAALILASQPAEAAAPGQVGGVAIDEGSNPGEITLTWSPFTATPPVTGYEYQLSKDGGAYGKWKAIPNSASLTTHTVTVTEAGEYRARMRAVNNDGNGETSRRTSRVDISVLTVPTNASILGLSSPSAGVLRLLWSAISDDENGGSPITRYEYQLSKDAGAYGKWKCIPNSASLTTFDIVGLAAGAYRVKMRGTNRIGAGAASERSISLIISGAPEGTTQPAHSCPGDVIAPSVQPDPTATLKIEFRNDSDGIVRPGQDVELTVTPPASVSRVTMQGLNLYAKKVSGSGSTATTALTLLGSEVAGNPFPAPDASILLSQAIKPGDAHTSGGSTYSLKISVPRGTPDGDYLVTAYGTTGVSAVERKLTVSSALVEVATVRFGPSAPRRAKVSSEDAKGGGTDGNSADGYADDASLPESTTIAAGAGSVEFTLSILNAANQAAEADDVASIFITTTGGTLTTSYALMTGPNKAATTDRNMTANCTAGATCQIDLSKLKGGKLLPKGIRVLLNAPATPGAATVRATVVAGGKVHQPEPVTVTFTGPAKSLSIGEPPSTVLGYDVVGKDKDGNDVADDVTKTGHKPETGAASRDELAFMVQATDGAAGAGSVVKTPTLTVMVRDSAGALVATGKYQTKQSGALMNMLLLDIDAPKATPLKPGEYKLTLSSTTPALKAERMFTVVGDGSTLELELAPMSADTFGQTVTATARVQDAAGNPVAAGTAVTFKVSDFSGGNDAVAVLDTEGAVLTNKDGVASAVLTVVGAGNAVVRATADKSGGGSLLKTAVLVSRAGAPAAEGEAGLDCLSELSGFAVWTCGGSTASALFELLSARGATAIHLWNGSVWVRYSVVDGTMVPGSRDFTVGESDIIYISN